MNFVRFFILLSSFCLIVWSGISAPYLSRRDAFSVPQPDPNISDGGEYDDEGDLGDDSTPPGQGFQQGIGPVTRPTDLGYVRDVPDDQPDFNDPGDGGDDTVYDDAPRVDDLGAPPPQFLARQQQAQQGRWGAREFLDGSGLEEDGFGQDGFRGNSNRGEVSYPRQGFRQRQGARAPERLIGPIQGTAENFPDTSEEFSGGDFPEQAQLPSRQYPPRRPELQSGQTRWNQIDVHSLVRDRNF